MNQSRFLVIGGSGAIGAFVVEALLAAGHRVRAVSRHGAVMRARLPAATEIVEADLTSSPLAPLLQDVDQVFYLAHGMGDKGAFAAREKRAATRLAEAAAASDIRHITYVGAMSGIHNPSLHMRARAATADALRTGGKPVTHVRATMVVAPGSAPLELMRDVAAHLPLVVVPWACRQHSAPLALDDLLAVLINLPLQPFLWGETIDLCGPESLRYTDQLRHLAAWMERRIRPIPLPLMPLGSLSWLAPLCSSAPTRIIRALVAGIREDMPPQHPLPRSLPAPQIPFHQALLRLQRWESHLPTTTGDYPGNPLLRGIRPGTAFYGLSIRATRPCLVEPAALWNVVRHIGGAQGYFFADWLWRLRERIDGWFGGHGVRRYRRHPQLLVLGDPIDSWTVMGLDPGKELLLRFGMKAPGMGHLRFNILPSPRGSRLTITAHWHPRGWRGMLYWWPLWPIHKLLFVGMARAICRKAETFRS